MTRVDSSTTLGVQRSLIGGELVPSTTSETFTTIHPGTNAVICEVEQAGEREVQTGHQPVTTQPPDTVGETDFEVTRTDQVQEGALRIGRRQHVVGG